MSESAAAAARRMPEGMLAAPQRRVAASARCMPQTEMTGAPSLAVGHAVWLQRGQASM